MTIFRFSSSSVWQTLTLSAILLLFLSGSAFAETVLYSFCAQANCADGSNPYLGLARGKDGVLYGTTPNGGQYGYGTAFELTPPAESGGAWTETVLYSFGLDTDCRQPNGPMILDKLGNLYGTATTGCIFELTPPTTAGGSWTETTISDWGGEPTGALTVGWEGSLYGTTYGEVFRVAREKTGRWIVNVVHPLDSGEDGYIPSAGVVSDKAGNLYGTTLGGGEEGCTDYSGCGVVFELSPPNPPGTGWTETILHRFTDQNGDGAWPQSPLVFDGAGNLYGTTSLGGSGPCSGLDATGCGTVFELSPSQGGGWTETILYAFTGGDDGSFPTGGVVLDASGHLYGTAYDSGRGYGRSCSSDGCGTVFELSPPSSPGGAWTETTLHEFKTGYEASIDGIGPYGGLVFGIYGALYGTTVDGGANGDGTVFSVHP